MKKISLFKCFATAWKPDEPPSKKVIVEADYEPVAIQ
jgi:hypothetical protein